MTMTALMASLDPAIVREGMRIAVSRKLSDAAERVAQARNNLSTPGLTSTTHQIIQLAPIARQRALGLLAAIDDLDAVIVECQLAWKTIDSAEAF